MLAKKCSPMTLYNLHNRIRECGSRRGDPLMSYLTDLSHPEGTIQVEVDSFQVS